MKDNNSDTMRNLLKTSAPIKVLKAGTRSANRAQPLTPHTAGSIHGDSFKNITTVPQDTMPGTTTTAAVTKTPLLVPASTAAPAAPVHTHEPEAHLVELSPGVYEIIFTCSCGKKSIIRCSSSVPTPATVPATPAIPAPVPTAVSPTPPPMAVTPPAPVAAATPSPEPSTPKPSAVPAASIPTPEPTPAASQIKPAAPPAPAPKPV